MTTVHKKTERGIIYILTNPAMPDYVKIGITNDGSNALTQRLASLDTTGLPTPFTCYAAICVDNCTQIEVYIHVLLTKLRIRKNREFFNISPEQAFAIFSIIKNQSPTAKLITVPEQFDDDLPSLSNAQRPRFNFTTIQLAPGTTIQFSRNPTDTAVIFDDSHVKYMGPLDDISSRPSTLSHLTKTLMHARHMNTKSDHYRGPAYWTYDGTLLTDLRDQLENTDTAPNIND